MADSTDSLCREIKRLIDKAIQDVTEITASEGSFKLWCGDTSAVAAFARNRQPLSAAIVDIVRKELVDYSLGLAASFDGSTAMADDGTRLAIIDQSGKELPSYLHSCLMDFFADHELR